MMNEQSLTGQTINIMGSSPYHLSRFDDRLGSYNRRPASEAPWTRNLWIYDLRTNQRLTLKTNPLTRAHLEDFVSCYRADDRTQREESERFRRFT